MSIRPKIAVSLFGIIFFSCSSAQILSTSGYAYRVGDVGRGGCVPAVINDAGQITGYSYTNLGRGRTRAFITGPRGLGVTVLGNLGGTDTRATDINNKGEVIGSATDVSGFWRGFITGPNGADLREFVVPGIATAFPTGINDSGEVVGAYIAESSRIVSFITGPGGVGFTPLETLGGLSTSANDINASGQVTGISGVVAGSTEMTHSFITGPHGVGITDLGLGEGTRVLAAALNDRGEVTGTLSVDTDGGTTTQQFVTGPDGTGLRPLGNLGDGPFRRGDGYGINNRGFAVGNSINAATRPQYSATLSNRQGQLIDLNHWVSNLPEDVRLWRATAINRYNQIAAQGDNGACYIVCPKKNCQK